MATVKQEEKCSMITLSGSAAMVRQYLEFGMSNVLYQRGVCPPEDFEQCKFYGLNLFKATNHQHVEYFARVLDDLEKFLAKKEVASVELVIINKDTREYLERWKFAVNDEEESDDSGRKNSSYGSKDTQVIRHEITCVIRQILGATTILPLLEENKIVYEIHATEKPGIPLWTGWHAITENTNIDNKDEMKFRSFSTSIHKIQSKVEYKKSS